MHTDTHTLFLFLSLSHTHTHTHTLKHTNTKISMHTQRDSRQRCIQGPDRNLDRHADRGHTHTTHTHTFTNSFPVPDVVVVPWSTVPAVLIMDVGRSQGYHTLQQWSWDLVRVSTVQVCHLQHWERGENRGLLGKGTHTHWDVSHTYIYMLIFTYFCIFKCNGPYIHTLTYGNPNLFTSLFLYTDTHAITCLHCTQLGTSLSVSKSRERMRETQHTCASDKVAHRLCCQSETVTHTQGHT